MNKIKVIKSILWWTKEYKNKPSKSDEEQIDVRKFPDDVFPAHINIARGETISTGKWQFVRIDVGITLPCFAEEVDEVFDFAEKKVRKRLNKLVAEEKK